METMKRINILKQKMCVHFFSENKLLSELCTRTTICFYKHLFLL